MPDNWADLPNLWRWTCVHCHLTIRTRTHQSCADRARQHLWDPHRLGAQLVVPVACMWDPRIKGHTLLATYDDDSPWFSDSEGDVRL